MTTKKTGSSISKHKTATTHKAAKSGPQAFDIIPRSQVRPQATARPVITANQPTVADNTLTAPPLTSLQLKHKPVAVKPSRDSGLTKDDVGIALPAELPSASDSPASADNKPAGVSVSELIAKRSKQEAEVQEAEVGGAATEDELKRALEEPLRDASVSQAVSDKPAKASVGDDKAVEPATGPKAGSDGSTDKTEPVDDKKPDEAHEAKVEVAANDKPVDIEDDESLQKVLNSEDKPAVQEHSQALKDAMKDMGEDGERPHHELYGGKPVIVVHKDHQMSAVAWVLWFFVCVGLALLIVNFLLDADIIQTTYKVPHTNLL